MKRSWSIAAAALLASTALQGDALAQRGTRGTGGAVGFRSGASATPAPLNPNHFAVPMRGGGHQSMTAGTGHHSFPVQASGVRGGTWRPGVGRSWAVPAAIGVAGEVSQPNAIDDSCLFQTHHGWIY